MEPAFDGESGVGFGMIYQPNPAQPLALMFFSASMMWHRSFTPTLSVIGHTKHVVTAAVYRVLSPVDYLSFRHLQGICGGSMEHVGLMKVFRGTEWESWN